MCPLLFRIIMKNSPWGKLSHYLSSFRGFSGIILIICGLKRFISSYFEAELREVRP